MLRRYLLYLNNYFELNTNICLIFNYQVQIIWLPWSSPAAVNATGLAENVLLHRTLEAAVYYMSVNIYFF